MPSVHTAPASSKDEPFRVIDGTRYARTTKILSLLRDPDLEEWVDEVGVEEAAARGKAARLLGNQLHSMIENDLRGQTIVWPKTISHEVKTGWSMYQEWKRVRRPQVRFVERLIWSESLLACGTVDLLDELGDGYLTDWKFSGKIRSGNWLQGNTYLGIMREWLFRMQENGTFNQEPTIKLPRYRRVVRLDPHVGVWEDEDREFSQKEWEIFKHLNQIYKITFPLHSGLVLSA